MPAAKKSTNFRYGRIESVGLSEIIGTDAQPIERQQKNTLRPFAIRYPIVLNGRVGDAGIISASGSISL